MKICFLNKSLNKTRGEGRFGLAIVEAVTEQQGMRAQVLVEEKTGHLLEKAVLRESYLLRNLLNLFINAIEVRNYIKDCDIIHALDAYPYGVVAALANIGLKKKFIINGIGTYSVLPLDKPIKKWFLKWAYKKANKVICISDFTKKQILKRVNLNNIIVINHGVDYNKYAEQHGYQRRTTQKEKIILSAGALKPRKGYHISIPAIAEVKKKYQDIKYYIVGGKPDKFYLDVVKKYNLEKNVKFFENILDKQLIKLYYQADIFLLTPIVINDNDFEGFGLVYLEAGACGKPVIGTFDCGAEDAIKDKVTGLLVPQNNIKKTVEAVLKLLDNPELARRLGENGKKRAREMNWDKVAHQYLEVYKNV